MGQVNDFCGFRTCIKWCWESQCHSYHLHEYLWSPPWLKVQKNKMEHRFPAVGWRSLWHGLYTTQAKPKVVERGDIRRWELCRKHKSVLDLSIWQLSTWRDLGKDGWEVLSPSLSLAQAHLLTWTPPPGPVLKSTSSSFSYSALWVDFLD